jgi:hypothetical protein
MSFFYRFIFYIFKLPIKPITQVLNFFFLNNFFMCRIVFPGPWRVRVTNPVINYRSFHSLTKKLKTRSYYSYKDLLERNLKLQGQMSYLCYIE